MAKQYVGYPYEVIVGSIGTVYEGSSLVAARSTYNAYVSLSKLPTGRTSDEDVTMFRHGEPKQEYIGTNHKEE